MIYIVLLVLVCIFSFVIVRHRMNTCISGNSNLPFKIPMAPPHPALIELNEVNITS